MLASVAVITARALSAWRRLLHLPWPAAHYADQAAERPEVVGWRTTSWEASFTRLLARIAGMTNSNPEQKKSPPGCSSSSVTRWTINRGGGCAPLPGADRSCCHYVTELGAIHVTLDSPEEWRGY